MTSAFSFPFTIPLSMLNSDVCGSPVVEVHDGLEGVPSPRGDVSLKAGKQRGHDVHAVLLTLPVREHSCIKTDRRPAADPSFRTIKSATSMNKGLNKKGSTCVL